VGRSGLLFAKFPWDYGIISGSVDILKTESIAKNFDKGIAGIMNCGPVPGSAEEEILVKLLA